MFIQVLKYAPTNKPSQPYVSTSNEAFALLYFEGMDGNLWRWWSKKQAPIQTSPSSFVTLKPTEEIIILAKETTPRQHPM
jgi:hypothetical protein